MALSTHQLDSNQDIGSLFFKHPSNIFISGPSGSGKTEFVKKMIEFKEDLFDILPQRIDWCYKEWQKSYNILQEREGSNIKFIQGIPDDEDEIVTDPSATHLVIFDDMLEDKDEEKSCGLQEKDIIEMQVWCTPHKIYFNKVNLLAPSV